MPLLAVNDWRTLTINIKPNNPLKEAVNSPFDDIKNKRSLLSALLSKFL